MSAAAPAKAGASIRRITGRMWADICVLMVLAALGIIGFEPSFGGYAFLLAGIGGLVLGAITGILAAVFRLGAITTVLAAIVAYFLVGTAVAVPAQAVFVVLPSLQSLASLAVGTVYGWSDIVTLSTPVGAPQYIAVVPYFAAWIVALVSTTLATRWLSARPRTAWRFGITLIGPVLLYLAGILIGTDEPYQAGLRGIVFGVLALVWLGWRRSNEGSVAQAGAARLRNRKIAGTAVIVAGSVLLGGAAGFWAAPANDQRLVLREEIQPPFDPLDYPSPLSGFRHYTKQVTDEVLFTVTGLKTGDVIRLATLDSFTGKLWNVAGPESDASGSGSFALVGRKLPEPTFITAVKRDNVTFTIDTYDDVWIPSVGYPIDLQFTAGTAKDESDDLRYNASTGTGVLTTGLAKGDSYTMDAEVQKVVPVDELSDAEIAPVALPPVSGSPDIVTQRAQEFAGSATTPIAQLEAMRLALINNGFLSHGRASDSVPSRAGHGADRITELFERNQMVGDQEQYASAYALMARSLGYPARLVMGFSPDVTDGQSVKVTGDDVTVWVEVAFADVGWVAFNPTPKETDIPQDQVPKPQSEPQPQVRQPPRAESDDDALLSPVELDDSDKDDKGLGFLLPGWVIVLGLSILIPAALFFIPLLIIGTLKTRRARRRREVGAGHDRVAGAWEELTDQYSELGFDVPGKLTRVGVAERLERQVQSEQSPRLRTLAVITDEAVFSGQEVDAARSETVWTEALAAVEVARSTVTGARRLLSRFRIRSARDWVARLAAPSQRQGKGPMKLKLTLQRPSGPEADIVVTTDAAASVADVAAAIAAVDPHRAKAAAPEGATLRIVDPSGSGHKLLEPEVALGEASLASGATIAIVAPGSTPPAAKAETAAVLRVVEGPDAGKTFPLPVGTRYLGRDAAVSDVTLGDPLVSKRHARLDVFSQAIRVVDLNSANGLEVDGGLVTRVDLENGATVRVGDTVLQAEIVAPAAESTPLVTGPIAFNRSPRVESRYPGEEYKAPTMPTEKDQQPFPWVAMLVPLALGVVFAFTGRGITSLIFIAASPLLMLGTYFSTRATRRRKEKLDIERFDERVQHLEATLDSEVVRERAVRKQESPSTMEVYSAAMELGPLLWTRRPEHWQFLSLNLGLGSMESRNTVSVSNEDAALPKYLDIVRATKEKYRLIEDVPVTENLFFSGALGVAGPHQAASDVARGIVVQLTGLHSPAELVVAAIVSNSWTPEFEWLKWLPHTGSPHSPLEVSHLANSQLSGEALISAIEELINLRNKAKLEQRGAVLVEKSALVAGASVGEGADIATPPPSATPAILLLLSGDAPVDRARLVQLSERGADAGVYPMWVAPTVAELPAVARTFVDVKEGGAAAEVGLVRLGSAIVDVSTEPIARDAALAFARRLSPVSDAGALLRDASDLPRTVSLLSLLGTDIAASPSVAVDRWRQNDSIHDRSGGPLVKRRVGRLRALVGQSGVDAMHLDLRTQGPHALVGGTTGSGKSEFLQAWVLGMAAEYSPDRVTFLFVDYKGGSAFADCVNLPHCVGLVTDLSPHLVRRALTSLRAELHYREHLFNRKKAKDLLDLEKRGDPESPPALVLVIDEFAALAGEVPEFVDGVVDIAQRGRSLGIHLIMATQRPAGVIKDNLRANTNLRIALRMADESDSMDVVGDKIAGTFDPSIPGRGIAKTGPGRLTGFQSAYAGGWTTDAPVAPSIDVAELRFGSEQPWEAPGEKVEVPGAGETGPTDQTRLVANLIAASKSLQLPAPRRPWLDDLAPAFDLTKLHQRTDTEIVLGVSDIPERQRQDEVFFRPDNDGNIAIYGAGGTGKTVTLRTIAAAAGVTPRGGPVDVYGMDFGTGGLKMLEAMPHVGSIVSGDDPDRIIRLLRMLRGVFEDRSIRYSAASAGSIGDYRRIASAPDERRIIVLVDNFPAFRSEFEIAGARSAWYGVFQQLLGEGRGLGIHVALTADRPGSVPTSVSSSIQRRVVHRLADENSYALLDMPNDVLSATSPPGRALVDGLETQIAMVGGDANVVEQAKAIAALGEAIARTGRAPADAIGTLPSEIPAGTLPAMVDGLPVLGLSDDTLAPVGFDPSGAFLLAGPPASGRTTALLGLIRAVEAAVPDVTRYYIGNARSSIGSMPGWKATATTVEDAAALARELAGVVANPKTKGKVVVVVEQIADFLNTPADAAIVDLTKATKRSDHFIIGDSETSQWSSSWPLLSEIKSARTGFLLQPDGIEGESILRTAIPRVFRNEFPPGRGYYVARGRASRVQLPLVAE